MIHFTKLKQTSQINRLDILIFLRQFATLISAGIPIIQSCDILLRMQAKTALLHLIYSIRQHIASGKTLSYSINLNKKYFDPLACQLIKIGEHTGKLDDMLNLLTRYYEKKVALSKKIQQLLFYPLMVMIISLWIIYGLLLFVIPHFAYLFQETYDQLPLLTRLIFHCSLYCQHIITIFFLIIHILFILLITSPSFRRKVIRFIKHYSTPLPFIRNLLSKIIFARFTRQLALMLTAGIPITQALKLVSTLETHTRYVSAITLLRSQLHSGQTLYQALKTTAYFPEIMIQMIKVGEETGKLDYMLDKTADFFESDMDYLASKLSKLIEPLIMLFLGALIGGIVIGMYLPIFKLGTIL